MQISGDGGGGLADGGTVEKRQERERGAEDDDAASGGRGPGCSQSGGGIDDSCHCIMPIQIGSAGKFDRSQSCQDRAPSGQLGWGTLSSPRIGFTEAIAAVGYRKRAISAGRKPDPERFIIRRVRIGDEIGRRIAIGPGRN